MRGPVVCVLLVACASSARDVPPPDAPGSGNDAPGGGGDAAGDAPACSPHGLPNLVDEQWNWVSVPGSACGNGSQAGFEINPTTRSKELVIYMMGGGGCYSAKTCGGPMPLAANLDGYGPATFAVESSWFGAGSIFDRGAPGNPLRDATWVFVPYCTGDFHSGNTIAPYGTHHVGYANVTAYLAQLAPAYCDASRIVLAGSSAGGFGSVFNYEHVQGAFPATPIDLIDDSGPPLRQITAQWQSTLRTAWAQVTPAGCGSCDQSWTAYVPFLAAAHPARRFSLISSLQDYSIGTYFGFNPLTYEAAVNDFADTVVAPLPNVRVFYIASNDHVWLNRDLQAITTRATSLSTFVAAELTGTTWTSIRP